MFWRQIYSLLYKHFLLTRRNRYTTGLKILIPVVFMIALFVITDNGWIHPTTEVPDKVQGIAKCVGAQCNCTLYYAPNSLIVDSIMEIVGSQNDPPLKLGVDILPTDLNYTNFQNQSFRTVSSVGGVFFNISNQSVQYFMVYNTISHTRESNRYNLQVAIDNAILQYYTKTKLSVSLGYFGGFKNNDEGITYYSLQSMSFLVVFAALTIVSYSVTSGVVAEKENNLRGYLRCFGVQDGAYWCSWAIHAFINHMFITIIILIMGYAAPDIKYFHNSNFFIHLVTFICYGIGIIGQSLFLSVVLNNTVATIVVVTMLLFLGLGLAFTCIFMGELVFDWWGPHAPGASYIAMYFLYTLPLFYYILGAYQISLGSVGSISEYYDVQISNTRYEFADMMKQAYPNVLTPMHCNLLMILLGVLYFILAWYLDSVLFDTQGARKSFYFFLKPSYWITSNKVNSTNHANKGIVVTGVAKFYKRTRALEDVSFQAMPGSVTVLLGRNGAGKTTILKILMGLTSTDRGTAVIKGFNVAVSTAQVRPSMGVCFQTDAYWPELTPREHLKLFALLKGLPNVEDEINEKLREVKLSKVANSQVHTFSGGMRRRLSVALSLLGDPNVVLLDEPTTGIDVMNQKCIWEAVNNIKKKGALVVLVTHSDEEANAVADRVVLIHEGEVRAEDNVSKIKEKYGINLVHVLVDVSKCEEVKSEITRLAPEMTIIAENAGSILYGFSKITKSSDLVRFLQTRVSIKDWKVSNANIDTALLITK